MRLERRDPGDAFAPFVAVPEGCGRDDVFVEDASERDGSLLGVSSGQYHPGMGWKPDDEDMASRGNNMNTRGLG